MTLRMLRDRAGLHRLVIGLAGAAEDQRVRRVDDVDRAVGVQRDLLLLQVLGGLLLRLLGRDVHRGVGDLADRARHHGRYAAK
jgi:hypothetical protein